MATTTSTLILYKTKITPEKNAIVDDLETYLSSCTKLTVNNFQYQKIALDITIKVDQEQDVPVNGRYNYCSINQDGKKYYYFILDYRFIAQHVVEYTLSIDSLNTFKNDWNWSNKTNIIRQHEDRFINTDKFVNNTNFTLHRNINKVAEGLGNTVKYKTGDEPIEELLTNDEVSTNFYLVYRTPEDASKVLEVALLAKDDIKISSSAGSNITWTASDLTTGTYYYLTYFDNPGASYSYYRSGTTVNRTLQTNEVIKLYLSGGQLYAKIPSINVDWGITNFTFKTGCKVVKYNVGDIYDDFYRISKLTTKIDMNVGGIQYLRRLDNLDRTDSKLLKIVELPYLPDGFEWTGNDLTTIPTGWSLNGNKELVLSDYSKEFVRNLPQIDFSDVLNINILSQTENAFKAISANPKYESKLYHSDLFIDKLVYDSFSSNIQLEKLFLDKNNRRIDLTFKPSNTITSNLIFKWYPNNGTYDETGDYDHYLVSNRNNELPVFTSDYLNYIRTGINYDRQKANDATAVSWITTAASIAGTALSAFAAVKTGGLSVAVASSLGISAFNSIVNSINTTIQSDKEIAQKLKELSNQSANVNTINDVDLFNYYGWQKLRRMQYSLSDNSKNAIYELFRKCGYAKNEFGVPNTVSRLRYNFIQCEAVFDNENNSKIFETFGDDIKARFASGVTVYHNVNNSWDFEQTYENWETNLF